MVAHSIVSVQLHLIITMEKAEVNWEFPVERSPFCRFSRSLAQKTSQMCFKKFKTDLPIIIQSRMLRNFKLT